MNGMPVRVVAWYDGAEQFALVRTALGEDARYFAGLAEGELSLDAIRRLAAQGVTVEPLARDGPGTEATPEFIAARSEHASAIDAAIAELARAEPGYAAAGPAGPPVRGSLRAFAGSILGGLVLTVGVLILGQQLGLVDPTAQTAVQALAAGALVAAIMAAASILAARLGTRRAEFR